MKGESTLKKHVIIFRLLFYIPTLGPALVIVNTAGGGDQLLIGLQLEEEQELEQILEEVAKELPTSHSALESKIMRTI